MYVARGESEPAVIKQWEARNARHRFLTGPAHTHTRLRHKAEKEKGRLATSDESGVLILGSVLCKRPFFFLLVVATAFFGRKDLVGIISGN